MSGELGSISPLAAFLASFLDIAIPAWALILLATALHWFFLLMPPVIAMRFLDRKLGADIQMRIGPNRSSPYGIFQMIADGVKLFFKEDAAPGPQESWLFKWGVVA